VPPSASAFLSVESGNNQTWLPSGSLLYPIVFKALGNPVADLEVLVITSNKSSFLALSHPGSPEPFASGLTPLKGTLDANGRIAVKVN
jgi:hypothetical protein